MLDVHTLEDGAQRADAVGERLVAWLGEAERSLDLALYDARLPGPVGDAVAETPRGAMRRGVRVRLAYNDDTPGPDPRPFEPPPPSTDRAKLETVGIPLRELPGWRDLMHPGGLRPPTAAASQAAHPPGTAGSFNLSRSGEMNAENVLEIADAELADRLAAWIDGLRVRYPHPAGHLG